MSDWPACRVRGLCLELLPDAIELDDWGYPMVTPEIPSHQVWAARQAVRTCPTLALRLVGDGL